MVTIASIGARRHAEKAAGWGVDAVIATGGEGGGHVGAVPTSLLVPQVAAAVDIPVIAVSGFFDGRGLVAALAWGAAGIAMGTRFLLTSDSPVADAVKQRLPGGGPGRHGGDPAGRRGAAPGPADDDGRPPEGRGRRERLGGRWCGRRVMRRRSGGCPGWAGGCCGRDGRCAASTGSRWGQVLMAANTPVLLRAAMVDGRTDLGLMSSGQVAGLIDDLPSCAELIESHHGRGSRHPGPAGRGQEGVKPGPFGLNAFDDRDVGLAAALAHGDAGRSGRRCAQLVEQRGEQAGAGGAERVAERDRAAADVHPVQVGAGLRCQASDHRGERLVDLDQVDVVQGEPGALAGRGRSRGSAR